MIAFFDTNIYLDVLKGKFSKDIFDGYFSKYVIRLCPVVYHELLRGMREALIHKVQRDFGKIIRLPAPTAEQWKEAALLIPQIEGSKDIRNLERLQNDVLIALTARSQGATVITQDRGFESIHKKVVFNLKVVGAI